VCACLCKHMRVRMQVCGRACCGRACMCAKQCAHLCMCAHALLTCPARAALTLLHASVHAYVVWIRVTAQVGGRLCCCFEMCLHCSYIAHVSCMRTSHACKCCVVCAHVPVQVGGCGGGCSVCFDHAYAYSHRACAHVSGWQQCCACTSCACRTGIPSCPF
jgi:hypothetical protein